MYKLLIKKTILYQLFNNTIENSHKMTKYFYYASWMIFVIHDSRDTKILWSLLVHLSFQNLTIVQLAYFSSCYFLLVANVLIFQNFLDYKGQKGKTRDLEDFEAGMLLARISINLNLHMIHFLFLLIFSSLTVDCLFQCRIY